MRRKLTAGLFLILSFVPGLNLAGSFQSICTITFDLCGGIHGEATCCASGCCQLGESCDEDCCLVIPENEPEFVAPETIGALPAPFLADLPPAFETPVLSRGSLVMDPLTTAPDPPPRAARLLMALIARHLI